jgi:hypothetical protein
MAAEMTKLAQHKRLVADTLEAIVDRPDEMAEFLSLYWGGFDRKKAKAGEGRYLAAQVKKGLRRAFVKFDAYQLAKWAQKDKAIKLRDVLRLVRPKPKNRGQSSDFRRLKEHSLPTPDTWETRRSKGQSAKQTFEELILAGKLPAMALLKNLRQMIEGGTDHRIIRKGLQEMKTNKVLPFRFLTAAVYAPEFEAEIEEAMLRSVAGFPKFNGKTIIAVDVSGSMYGTPLADRNVRELPCLSSFLGRHDRERIEGAPLPSAAFFERRQGKGTSVMDRAHVAISLAILLRELCEYPVIYATAGHDHLRQHRSRKLPSRHGFSLADAIYGQCHPLGGGGIFLNQLMSFLVREEGSADRVVVITDEQDCSIAGDEPDKAWPLGGVANYIVNVAPYQNGIAYSRWTHIDGWSEQILRFMTELERGQFLQ